MSTLVDINNDVLTKAALLAGSSGVARLRADPFTSTIMGIEAGLSSLNLVVQCVRHGQGEAFNAARSLGEVQTEIGVGTGVPLVRGTGTVVADVPE